ncbi:MAG: hypothetical protein ACJ74H_02945 [Thermoanaerobaculia bacterium]
MKLVRGRADARWLPSRHNFALFRLAAFLRLRRAAPEHRNVILVIDRHQSALETWTVMLWLIVTLACYLAVTLFASWPVTIALITSLPIAFVLLEVPAIISALVIAPFTSNGIRANSIAVMLLFTAASAYFATHATWIRFVAWHFLTVLALNAVAAMIVFASRGAIAQLERGVTSAP